MTSRAAAIGLGLALMLAREAGAQTPNGPEFQVNTYTTGSQYHVKLALDGSGHLVVAFGSRLASEEEVFARRLTSGGEPRGPEFRVNTYTTGEQNYPAVAADRAGNFVVTWNSYEQDGDEYGVLGQRYDASGVPVGAEFQVNTYTTGWQYNSSVAMDPAGNFVVVWQDPTGQDGSSTGVFGRRYDVTAGTFGAQFRVNSWTTGSQTWPSVATAADGSFVVVWSGSGPGDSSGIFARRFDTAATPLGAEFHVNAVTASSQFFASVASATDGAFVVVWQDYALDGSNNGIFGQRYDAGGNPAGGQFAVNTYTTGEQLQPKVAVDRSGAFMVTWWNYVPPAIGGDTIRARQFDASGTAVGPEFGVNSYTTGTQADPVIAAGPAGEFVVAWQGGGAQDGNGYGVFGQRYGDLVFADTFDSGTVSNWSSAATGGGDLTVTPGAALGGTAHGLQAVVNDTTGLFVHDDAPADENRYRSRFYFDPNGFDPGVAQAHLRTRIFIGFEEAPNRRLFAVVLRLQGGQYALMGRARRDDNGQTNTGFFPISDAPHWIELDWRRASGPDALDGSFQMWIDGVSVSTLTGLDNSVSALDFVRLGALSVKSGAAGTMLYDEFVSRRETFIGPLP
jgi:hypothetical protein